MLDCPLRDGTLAVLGRRMTIIDASTSVATGDRNAKRAVIAYDCRIVEGIVNGASRAVLAGP